MNLHPVRSANLYVGTDTHTAQDYRLARYQKLMPANPDEGQASQVARFLTSHSQKKLTRLRTYLDGWDGYGSARPDAEAIANAEARLPELFRLATLRGVWREPHVSASEDGEVTFEWLSGARKVTMYFGRVAIEIVRSWGTNIDSEMDHSTMPTLDSFPAVWAWLYGN